MNIVIAIPGFSTDTHSDEGKRVRKVIRSCADKIGSAKIVSNAVVFSLDSAFHQRSSDCLNATALEAMMTCMVELNKIWLYFHPTTLPLYTTPVYYERTLVWDTIPSIYTRGWGDCKSLAAIRVAENFRDGIWSRPVHRFNPGKTNTMYHILVMYERVGFYQGIGASEDGMWEDPSKALGMEAYQERPDAPRQTHRS